MTAHVVGAAVILSGDALWWLRYALRAVERERRRNGAGMPAELVTVTRHIDTAIALTPAPSPPRHDDDAAAGDEEHQEWIDSATAATILRRSRRTTQRLAPQLGARRLAGRLMFDRAAVEAHSKEHQ